MKQKQGQQELKNTEVRMPFQVKHSDMKKPSAESFNWREHRVRVAAFLHTLTKELPCEQICQTTRAALSRAEGRAEEP